jgi:hypothetical protein
MEHFSDRGLDWLISISSFSGLDFEEIRHDAPHFLGTALVTTLLRGEHGYETYI